MATKKTSQSQKTTNSPDTDTSQLLQPTYLRDEYGLLKGVNYVYDENNLISWEKMVPLEHFFPNPDKTEETDVNKLSYDYLIIRLTGLEYLARLRGIKKIEYRPVTGSPDYYSTVCSITWMPNYESDFQEQVTENTSSVVPETCNPLVSYYLAEMSANRAFCRCVRRFLGIRSVSSEEVAQKGSKAKKQLNSNKSKSKGEGNNINPLSALKKTAKDKKISLNQIQELVNEQDSSIQLESIDDVPESLCFYVIGKIKEIS